MNEVWLDSQSTSNLPTLENMLQGGLPQLKTKHKSSESIGVGPKSPSTLIMPCKSYSGSTIDEKYEFEFFGAFIDP